ncbi:MAG: metalloregulator ArsR/SmtB family transcription factor [Bryobacteraceae bacterium]|nr:metalloregulator ArsR/SmtB family transcription factor [Bryobacteraceae bacterium]
MSHQQALHALSDPTRREIFEKLRRSSASVSELAEGMPVTRPAVSQHLKVLKSAGLVRESRRGVHRVYQVDLKGLVALRRYIDTLWTDVLEGFQQEADRSKEP